jgi:hypothetical protein
VPAGSGTVTHTVGALTANALVLGNGGADTVILGSLGTTTTLLHGNAAGAPTYGAVVLTTDVSGILPGANGGTGNGFFAVTGPAASLKTFTFPNASASVLTDNTAVTTAQGGTGTGGALTGLVRGGNPFTAAELSGDATTSGSNVVTVAKINGNTVPSGAVAHQTIIATGANAFSLKTINDCTGGASALSFAQSGDAIGCLTSVLTGTLTSTRVPFASGTNALTDSANLTYAAASGFTQVQGANGADAFLIKRNTDAASTGNFLRFRDNAATTDLFKVDVTGAVTATAYNSTNPSGNSGMVSLVQGTAPSDITNAVNLLAPASVTTYHLTFPSAVAAGFWRQNSSGTMSFTELSGDATTSNGGTVTVVKVNGVAYPTTGASFDGIGILTASNSLSYFQINGGSSCGDSTHALSYNVGTHLFGCQNITAAAPGAGGSNTQVQFNSANALAGSANLTWVSPTLTVGAAGAATGIIAFGGATSGTTSLTGNATGSGTVTLPAATDTLVGKATTDTLTNKTFDTAGTGNVFNVNGTRGTTGQVMRATTSASPQYIDFPQPVYAPAANCVNAVAGSGWSTGATPAALCRAGTNNKDGLLSPWGASDVGYFKVHLPNDWDSGASLDITIDLTSTDAVNGHTIIMQAATACGKGDGSTTDDVAFNTAQSFGTITLNGNANRTWNATLTGLTKTGCTAGSTLWVKISRTSDTATNVGVYGATVDVARLLAVQAN